MLTNQHEVETLARVIFEEVQQSFHDQDARPGLQLSLPWERQPEVIRQAYMRGAAAANTHLINLTVRQTTTNRT